MMHVMSKAQESPTRMLWITIFIAGANMGTSCSPSTVRLRRSSKRSYTDLWTARKENADALAAARLMISASICVEYSGGV